jgi:hypothetical protein
MSTIPEAEPRRVDETQPEDGPEFFRAHTEFALSRELETAQSFMGPAQFATAISSSIGDNDFLRDMIKALNDNWSGRVADTERNAQE